jgi:hypothetical protein
VLLGSVDGDWTVVACFPPPKRGGDCRGRVHARQSLRTFDGEVGVVTVVKRKKLEVGWTDGYSMETVVISTAPPPHDRLSFAVVTATGSLDWGLVEPVPGALPQTERLAIEKATDEAGPLILPVGGPVLLDWVRETRGQTQWLVLRKGDATGCVHDARLWTADAGRWRFQVELPDTCLLTSLEFVARLTDSSKEATLIMAGSCRNSFYPVLVAVTKNEPQVWAMGCGI